MLHLLVSCFVLRVIFVFDIIIAHLIDSFEIIDLLIKNLNLSWSLPCLIALNSAIFDRQKILPRLLTMNSMVYTSTIFKCWGYPEKSEWPRCPVFSTFVRQKKYYQGRWPWIPWFTIQPYLNDSYPEKSGRPRCPVFSTFNPQKNITKVVDHEHHGLQFNHI